MVAVCRNVHCISAAGLEAAKHGVLPVNMDGINAKNGLFAWSSIFSYPNMKVFLFSYVVVYLVT